jgi:hypothetical protein
MGGEIAEDSIMVCLVFKLEVASVLTQLKIDVFGTVRMPFRVCGFGVVLVEF